MVLWDLATVYKLFLGCWQGLLPGKWHGRRLSRGAAGGSPNGFLCLGDKDCYKKAETAAAAPAK